MIERYNHVCPFLDLLRMFHTALSTLMCFRLVNVAAKLTFRIWKFVTPKNETRAAVN